MSQNNYKQEKIKEPNRKVSLFPVNSKPIVFRHCDIIWSDEMFLRFFKEDGEYICFSGSYLTEADN